MIQFLQSLVLHCAFLLRTIFASSARVTERKIGRNLWLLFLANEINSTDKDVTGPTEQVQIMFPLKDKNINQ